MNARFVRTTGWFMIIAALCIGGSWTGLIATFDYPDVLRFEPAVVLERYEEGGAALRLYWAGMALSGLLLMTLSVMLHQMLSSARRPYLMIGTMFGVAAGVFNVLGFIRWVFTMNVLTGLYLDPLSTAATKEAVIVNYEVMNSYFGVSVGETLGYCAMSIWILILCSAIWSSKLMHASIPLIGILCGLGTLIGLLEWAGWDFAAEINAYALQGWLLLMIVMGGIFIRKPKQAGQAFTPSL